MNPNYPQVAAYTFLQPLRKVNHRTPNSAGAGYRNETLECGHTLIKQRVHKRRGQAEYYLPDHRRCPLCQPDPPPLRGVEVVLDNAVPYEPGNGFHYVNDAGRVSLTRTNKVRMHPDYHAHLPPDAFLRSRLFHALCESAWECSVCGMKGKNPGGRATHYRVKHGQEV